MHILVTVPREFGLTWALLSHVTDSTDVEDSIPSFQKSSSSTQTVLNPLPAAEKYRKWRVPSGQSQDCACHVYGVLRGQSSSEGSSQAAFSPSEVSDHGEKKPLGTQDARVVSGRCHGSPSREMHTSSAPVPCSARSAPVPWGPDRRLASQQVEPTFTDGLAAAICAFSLWLSCCLSEGRQDSGHIEWGCTRAFPVTRVVLHTHCGAGALWEWVLPRAPPFPILTRL